MHENKVAKRLFSVRKTQVLTLIAEGKTNQEIADDLEISKRTVDFHIRDIFQMLDVKNRVQAVNQARFFSVIPRSDGT